MFSVRLSFTADVRMPFNSPYPTNYPIHVADTEVFAAFAPSLTYAEVKILPQHINLHRGCCAFRNLLSKQSNKACQLVNHFQQQ